MWEDAVDGLFRTADTVPDGDSLLCSIYSRLLFSSLFAEEKDVAQISVGPNICSASVEVQAAYEVKLVCACVLFVSHRSVIELLVNILKVWLAASS